MSKQRKRRRRIESRGLRVNHRRHPFLEVESERLKHLASVFFYISIFYFGLVSTVALFDFKGRSGGGAILQNLRNQSFQIEDSHRGRTCSVNGAWIDDLGITDLLESRLVGMAVDHHFILL
jgi:hypothetical protein